MFVSIPAVALITIALTQSIKTMYFTLLTIAFSQIISRVAKKLIERERPTRPTPSPSRFFDCYIPLSKDDPDGAPFPSGDAMAGS